MALYHSGGRVTPFHSDHHPVSIYEGAADGTATTLHVPSTQTATGTALTLGNCYNDRMAVTEVGESGQLAGYAVDFNQLSDGYDATKWELKNATYTSFAVSGGTVRVTSKSDTSGVKDAYCATATAGHKYLIGAAVDNSANTSAYGGFSLRNGKTNGQIAYVRAAAGETAAMAWAIGTAVNDSDYIGAYMGNAAMSGDFVEVSGAQAFDLTQMFGEGHEPSTVAEFRAMYGDDYYAYMLSDHRYLGTDWETAYPTPSPDYPQPITSRTGAGVTVTDGAQTATLSLADLLAGTELRSLPDGTADSVTLGRDGEVTLVQRCDPSKFDPTASWADSGHSWAYDVPVTTSLGTADALPTYYPTTTVTATEEVTVEALAWE